MKTINTIALALIIVGGINWGLIAVAQFDLVAAIFGGQDAPLSRVVYGLVGLAAVYALTLFKPLCACSSRSVTTPLDSVR